MISQTQEFGKAIRPLFADSVTFLSIHNTLLKSILDKKWRIIGSGLLSKMTAVTVVAAVTG